MSIKASFKDKQLNTSEINNNYLFVSLVFYGLETCVKKMHRFTMRGGCLIL